MLFALQNDVVINTDRICSIHKRTMTIKSGTLHYTSFVFGKNDEVSCCYESRQDRDEEINNIWSRHNYSA